MAEPTAGPRLSTLGAHTLAARVAAYFIGAIASIVIARALGPSGRGTYALPVTLATIAVHVGSMGTHTAQFRLWSRRDATPGELLASATWLAGGLGVCVAGTAWLVYLIGRNSSFSAVEATHLLLVLITLPVQIHSLLATNLLVLNGQIVRTNVALVAGAFAHLTLVITAFATEALTVTAVLALYVVGAVVPWIVVVPGLTQLGRFLAAVPWRLLGKQLRLGATAQPYILLVYLILRMDVFLVARYGTLVEVGLYAVAVTLAELVWVVTDALSYPTSERQANVGDAEAVALTLVAVRMSILLAVVVGVSVGAAATIGIRTLYGDEFVPARSAVWSLIPASIGMAVWRLAGNAQLRLGSVGSLSAIAGVALVANLAANVVLIPILGIAGAGLASAASYALGAGLLLWRLSRKYPFGFRDVIPGRAEWSRASDLAKRAYRRLASLPRPTGRHR